MDLLLLLDLYNVLGEDRRAVRVIRNGTRWLQGRLNQKYWDMDREYDLEGWPKLWRTQSSVFGSLLDTNARHRLAVARIKMGDIEEGKVG